MKLTDDLRHAQQRKPDLSQLSDEDLAAMAGDVGAELLQRIANRTAELAGYRARALGQGMEACDIEPCEGIGHLAGYLGEDDPITPKTVLRVEQRMCWGHGWETADRDLGGDLEAEAEAAMKEVAP